MNRRIFIKSCFEKVESGANRIRLVSELAAIFENEQDLDLTSYEYCSAQDIAITAIKYYENNNPPILEPLDIERSIFWEILSNSAKIITAKNDINQIEEILLQIIFYFKFRTSSDIENENIKNAQLEIDSAYLHWKKQIQLRQYENSSMV